MLPSPNPQTGNHAFIPKNTNGQIGNDALHLGRARGSIATAMHGRVGGHALAQALRNHTKNVVKFIQHHRPEPQSHTISASRNSQLDQRSQHRIRGFNEEAMAKGSSSSQQPRSIVGAIHRLVRLAEDVNVICGMHHHRHRCPARRHQDESQSSVNRALVLTRTWSIAETPEISFQLKLLQMPIQSVKRRER